MFGFETKTLDRISPELMEKVHSRIENPGILRDLLGSNEDVQERLISKIMEIGYLCNPLNIRIIEGTEQNALIEDMVKSGKLIELNEKSYPDSYLHRSDPKDVARTEKSTFICTDGSEADAGPTNNWMHTDEASEKLLDLLKGSMEGKTMYVVPYWLGPLGSPYGQAGVEFTDSPYVVANLNIITKSGKDALSEIARTGRFVLGIHSARNLDPEKRYICHFPQENLGDGLIMSVNTDYGGNALLSKKCHALRIAGARAYREGWMAEHMMLIGLTDPDGRTTFVSGAFPSSSGKTNLSMLEPIEFFKSRGWKTELVSDDIIWLNENKGRLNGINPESGFFGVVPNTNYHTNPNAMKTITGNTIFTNVALDSNLEPFWEGLGPVPENLTDWQGNPYRGEGKAAHPNSRFTSSILNYPKLSGGYDEPAGVPLSVIFYGGRRKDLIPLIYGSLSWEHGVLIGAMQRVETTAAIVGKVGVLRNDPMANRPFVGYNMADYFDHHLKMAQSVNEMPRVFNVNWFRVDRDGKFLWPGFGHNLFAVKWAIDMFRGETDNFVETPIGFVPTVKAFEGSGVDTKVLNELLYVDKKGFLNELEQVKPFFESFGDRFPKKLWDEYYNLKERLESWKS